MLEKGERVDSFGEYICCLMVGGAVDQLDLAFMQHGPDEVVADVDVLQLG